MSVLMCVYPIHHSLSNLDSNPTGMELDHSGAAGIPGATKCRGPLARPGSSPTLGEVVAVLQLKMAVRHQRPAVEGEL